MNQAQRLVWIDLEMTGLDVQKERIIEMAAIVTDNNLETIAVSEVMVIKQSDQLLSQMDQWNQQTHGKSGLIERVRASTLSEAQAEADMLAFLRPHLAEGTSPMCGNSIGQDRRFLDAYMPTLATFFHYRNLDVSTLKELAQRWAPQLPPYAKKNTHRALDDIKESIEELRYFRQTIMKI